LIVNPISTQFISGIYVLEFSVIFSNFAFEKYDRQMGGVVQMV